LTAIRKILKAFLVGGCFGLIGQLLIALFAIFISDATMVIMVSILAFGVIAVVIIANGFYFKVAEFGDSGAAIPVCGLMFGAATSAAAAQKAGAKLEKAFIVGFWNVLKILGTGFVIAFILGLLLC
jgi:hypothetical protein